MVRILIAALILAGLARGQSWVEVVTPTSPPAMTGTALAHDLARRETVMLGSDGSTWVLDGVRWTQRHPVQSPPARGSRLVYDRARQRVLLFGGIPLDQRLWEWDGTNWSVLPASAPPPAREGHGLVYDSARDRVIVYGGRNRTTGAILDDTWEWDGTSWHSVATASTPGARFDFGMAYDVLNKATVVIGGSKKGDAWSYDGANWKKLPQPHFASASYYGNYHFAAYDSFRGRVAHVAVNKTSVTGSIIGMEAWNGVSWLRISSVYNSPFNLVYASPVFDANRGSLIRFGGLIAGTHRLTSKTIHYKFPYDPSATTIGSGCTKTGSPPVLSAKNPAAIGNQNFEINLSGAKPNSLMILGLSPIQTSTAIGACTLFALPPLLLVGPAATSVAGETSLPLPIPFQIALQGSLITCQAFVVDPNGGYAGLAFTNGLQLVLGS